MHLDIQLIESIYVDTEINTVNILVCIQQLHCMNKTLRLCSSLGNPKPTVMLCIADDVNIYVYSLSEIVF